MTVRSLLILVAGFVGGAVAVALLTSLPGAEGHRQVPLWLESAELRPLVIGFESASAGHGREGALYVRVRRVR